MKIVDIRPPKAPILTVSCMSFGQVFEIGIKTYIKVNRDHRQKSGVTVFEAFCVNDSKVYDLKGSHTVSPVKAELHKFS